MKYFKYFNDVIYSQYGTNFNLKDITNLTAINNNIKDDILYYNFYTVLDGERPDHVSMRLYGTPDYYWTIFLMNEKLTNFYRDWYKSSNTMQTWLDETYPYFVVEFENSIAGEYLIGEDIESSFNTNVIGNIVDIDNQNYKLILSDVQDNGVPITNDSEFNGIFPQGTSAHGISSNGFGVITGFYKQQDSTFEHIGTIEDSNGTVVNPEFSINRISISEVEKEKNDDNGRIIVIKPEFITQVVSDFINKIDD